MALQQRLCRRTVCVAVNGGRFGRCLVDQAMHLVVRPESDELHIVAVADNPCEPDSEVDTVQASEASLFSFDLGARNLYTL